MVSKSLKILRWLVFTLIGLNILILLIFPTVFSKVVQPAIIQLVIERNEERAIQIGNFLLADSLNFEDESAISTEFSQAVNHFNLKKIKWFSSNGVTTFSTDTSDIGKINKRDYFVEQVTKGIPYSQFVHKEERTAEGQILGVDIIETYVPIMKEETFIGAFEIYHIVTDELSNSMSVLIQARNTFITIAIIMLTILVVISITFMKVESELLLAAESAKQDKTDTEKRNTPLKTLLIVIGSIAISEFLLMLYIGYLDFSHTAETLLDSILLSLILTPILYFGVFKPLLTNIRALDERELLLKEAKQSADKANRSKSRFLANMTHELRTPMNAVIGMSHLLERSDLTCDQRECIDTILSSGEVLLSVVNNVLDISKMESGKLTLESTEFNIRTLVYDTLHILSVIAKEKGLTISVTIDEGINSRLIGDPMRLKQIIINLGNNALKFTKEGEVNIALTLLKKEDSRQTISFSVSDTGVGVPEHLRETIFTPFTQVDESTSRKFGGTGLGLTISNEFVKLMGGSISVSSSDTWATIVSFVLDFDTISDDINSKPRADLSNKQALFLTDNTVEPHPIEVMLKKMGMNVEKMISTFEDSEKLIQRLNNKNMPDALVVENNATCETCICREGLVKRISWGPDIASLVIPVHCGRGGASICHNNGYKGFLSKPFEYDELETSLQLLLGAVEKKRDDQAILTRYTLKAEAKKELKIAIVDDNPTNLRVACKTLQKLGYLPKTYNCGEDFIDAFTEEQPQIIFMDIHMPLLDGFQTTSIVRDIEIKRGLKPSVIFALTAALIDLEDEKQLKETLFNGVILKPFTVQDLEEKLQDFFERNSLTQ